MTGPSLAIFRTIALSGNGGALIWNIVSGHRRCLKVERFWETLAEFIDARCVQPIALVEIDARPFPAKLRDAATRLATPYV
jgi:hypothetical protein